MISRNKLLTVRKIDRSQRTRSRFIENTGIKPLTEAYDVYLSSFSLRNSGKSETEEIEINESHISDRISQEKK